MDNFNDRIIALEEKFSHQDELVNKLNIIIAAQQTSIRNLSTQLGELKESSGAGGVQLNIENLKDERPPHY